MIVKLALFIALLGLLAYSHWVYGAKATFIRGFLLVLLFVPLAFKLTITPAIPPLTFLALASLVVFCLAYAEQPVWFEMRTVDYLVLLAALWDPVAGLLTEDWKYASLLLFDNILYQVMPYFTARLLIDRGSILRTLVFLGFAITALALVSPLEFLFNFQPPRLLQYLWPDWVMDDPFIRGGNYRVFSTLGHPIHAGMVFSLGLFIGFLLMKLKVLDDNRIPWLLVIANGIGIYATVSRTAYFLAIPMVLLIGLAFVKEKKKIAIGYLAACILIISIGLPIWERYTTIDDLATADETQTSAAYRAVLFDTYVDFVGKSPVVGYGLTIPTVGIMGSIDNNYLLLMLRYGIPSALFFGIILLLVITRGTLLFFSPPASRNQVMLWTLVSFLVFFFVVAFTVWFPPHIRALLAVLTAMCVNTYDKSRPQSPLILNNTRWI